MYVTSVEEVKSAFECGGISGDTEREEDLAAPAFI